MISKSEAEAARADDSRPVSDPSVEIEISIPIRIGGYTGQRDSWEDHQYKMTVRREGSNVVLKEPYGDIQRKVTIPWHALQAALAAKEALGR